jgi:hypothetical protein
MFRSEVVTGQKSFQHNGRVPKHGELSRRIWERRRGKSGREGKEPPLKTQDKSFAIIKNAH